MLAAADLDQAVQVGDVDDVSPPSDLAGVRPVAISGVTSAISSSGLNGLRRNASAPTARAARPASSEPLIATIGILLVCGVSRSRSR